MVVALDGPAGVGKSSISRMISERLSFFYLNSGNFYRTITLAVLESGRRPEAEEEVIGVAQRARISLEKGRMHLADRDVEEQLHNDRVDRWVAQHSAIVEVRHIVNRLLRKCSQGMDIVAEGRDMATVVFPDADLKIYMDADARTRAMRRYKQGTSDLSLEEIQEGIMRRDEIDKSKIEGSLKIAEDAFYLDTSDLTIEEVCETVLGKIGSIAQS